MTNYYQTLNIKTNASSFRIFKAFKSAFLSADGDGERQKELLEAYMLLQEPCRKFYDLAWKQQKSGKVNDKYESVVQKRITLSHQRFQSVSRENMRTTLREFPSKQVLQDLFGFIMGIEMKSMPFIVVLLCAGFCGILVNLETGKYGIASLFIGVAALGFIWFRYQILVIKESKLTALLRLGD
ncbi:MAG: hypothetical protein HWD92_06320 [Flavobacteriia bacterium]|nr:hypothetical protein [Flavobacteriia bacterium]